MTCKAQVAGHAQPISGWLEDSIQEAFNAHSGKPVMQIVKGGTVSSMAILGKSFPKAQFVITGVMGPGSNAHGPKNSHRCHWQRG